MEINITYTKQLVEVLFKHYLNGVVFARDYFAYLIAAIVILIEFCLYLFHNRFCKLFYKQMKCVILKIPLIKEKKMGMDFFEQKVTVANHKEK